MIRYYWVKFQDYPPEKYHCQTFEQFWHEIRENMLRNQRILEWIIVD